jgi:hypothetical protein
VDDHTFSEICRVWKEAVDTREGIGTLVRIVKYPRRDFRNGILRTETREVTG